MEDAQQFNDPETGSFFMRIVFRAPEGETELRARIAGLMEGDIDWQLRDAAVRMRVLILVSKFDHCLGDLLYRGRIGEMPMDIVGIISNLPREALDLINLDAPFHYLPVSRDTKPARRLRLDLLRKSGEFP